MLRDSLPFLQVGIINPSDPVLLAIQPLQRQKLDTLMSKEVEKSLELVLGLGKSKETECALEFLINFLA